jgi:hypothetical protein
MKSREINKLLLVPFICFALGILVTDGFTKMTYKSISSAIIFWILILVSNTFLRNSK